MSNPLFKKIIAVASALCMLPSLITGALSAEYTYAEPIEAERWVEPDFSTDHAYSIAFVGDPQFINNSDVTLGEKKMEQLFGILADTAEERKLKHVFVLGDITHVGYRNDYNLAAAHNSIPQTGEWENAQKSILQLSEAGISYSLCRGNHDDYMMDDYFNIPAYTDQFKGCGGFFSDSTAKYSSAREPRNPEKYVYWSALTGYHKDSIVNSYKTMEICGNKYLFVTVDFNPTMRVVDWLNGILEEYSDHMAIVTTHAYLSGMGRPLIKNDGTMYDLGVSATQLWETCLKKHENLLMIVSGHVGTTKPLASMQKGENGNVVREFLVNPQNYDRQVDEAGNMIDGVQDTGAIFYMNFSEDGSKVTFDYYSTLMNKEFAQENTPLTLYEKKPEAPKDQPVDNKVEEETVPSSEAEQLSNAGPNAGVIAAVCGGAVIVAGGVTVIFLVRKKKKS